MEPCVREERFSRTRQPMVSHNVDSSTIVYCQSDDARQARSYTLRRKDREARTVFLTDSAKLSHTLYVRLKE